MYANARAFVRYAQSGVAVLLACANALACANGVGVASQRPTRLGITDPLCLRDALAYATGVWCCA
ncbi:hypothetical protein CH298_16915 [Rhodococcoides fascians]|nr:hypothetical protein CH303_17270 [Rhodococcus fascians]OZF15340.1 hypothetical protein CH298_16915 [Rhodococcus fascians]OZF18890.1 hypothetical protein CH297_17295 [Rhodococcus fascians]OZF64733.1 hypothetical protein CH308_17190 [Rhodococcus fascians]OZF67967.1 hypothetical protein CH307_17390 [Rhodococcus fascians]